MDKLEFKYDQDGVIIRNSKPEDAIVIAEGLRKSDREEVWCSHNYNSLTAMDLSLKNSIMAFTIELNGIAIGAFGCVSDNIMGNKASIWFLSTDAINKLKIKFLRNNRRFIDMMLEVYPYLYNWVDARNDKSIAWIKFLGGNIKEAIPYGVENKLFHYFTFTRV